MDIPNQLKTVRTDAGLTQEEVGKAIGKEKQSIWRYENGKTVPDASTYLSILKVAGHPLPLTGDSASTALPPVEPGNALLVRGEGYFENAETGVLTIYDGSDVQAGAGPNGFGFEVFEDNAIEVRYYRQMMQDLLGFWPPQDMRGMRVVGHSMMPTIEPGQLVLYRPMEQLEGIVTRRRYIISLMNVKTETWTPMAKQIVRRSTDGFRIVSENKSLGEPDTVLLAEKGRARFTRQDSGEEVKMAVLGEILWPQRDESDRSKQVIAETLEILAAEGALQTAR
jgi:transcriptional regulator with XRE-family HTH domain